jgi:hypothetical protein
MVGRTAPLAAATVCIAAIAWHLSQEPESVPFNSSLFVPWDKLPEPHSFLGALEGVTQKDFMENYFERQVLVTRASQLAKKVNLTLSSDLHGLVERRGFRYTKVAKEGIIKELKDMATEQSQETGDFLRSLLQLRSGNPSIILNALQEKATKPLTLFAQNLEAMLGVYPSFNAYVSPPSTKALNEHWDQMQDIFVVQLDGEKTWLVCDPSKLDIEQLTFKTPLRGQFAQFNLQSNTDACVSHVLRQGDVLYMPSGTIHSASTTESPSLHLTVSLLSKMMTMYDFVQSFLGQARGTKHRTLSSCSRILEKRVHAGDAAGVNMRRRFPLWELDNQDFAALETRWTHRLVSFELFPACGVLRTTIFIFVWSLHIYLVPSLHIYLVLSLHYSGFSADLCLRWPCRGARGSACLPGVCSLRTAEHVGRSEGTATKIHQRCADTATRAETTASHGFNYL